MSAAATAGVALVGPTHPFTGGIAHHTTALAHRLDAREPTALVSWSRQYPARLYKGTATVPLDAPEVEVFPATTYPLAWDRPGSWWRAGRSVRAARVLALAVVTPFHAVPYAGLLRGAGRGPRRVAIVHNVLPHESSPVDRALVRALLGSVDRVVVHSEEQAEVAAQVGVRPDRLRVAALAPHLPAAREPLRAGTAAVRAAGAPVELLFFGTVRPYKGLDVLLRSLALAPRTRLTVAGDFWQPLAELQQVAGEAGVLDRVVWRPGYVQGGDLPELFAAADVSVLPYRSGTASQNVALAASHGVPSVVTSVGTLAADVRDGVDGLVVPAMDVQVQGEDVQAHGQDVERLGRTLRRLEEPGLLEQLRRGVCVPDQDGPWDAYVEAVLGD